MLPIGRASVDSAATPRSPNPPGNTSPSSISSADRYGFATHSCSSSPHKERAFTDPTNPFNRRISKGFLRTQSNDARLDPSRAGLRTKNPGKMPVAGIDYVSPKDSRERCVPHRYGNDETKLEKSIGAGGSIFNPLSSSEGITAVLGGSPNSASPMPQSWDHTILGNYLNDMKRTWSKSKPRATKLNEITCKVPTDRPCPVRSASCEPDFLSRVSAGPRRRFMNYESDSEDNYGFSRKGPVEGRSSLKSSAGFLAHEERQGPAIQPPTKGDARFEELVAHLKSALPVHRQECQALKVRSERTDGFLDTKSVVKFEI